jgi:hypothetical protein
LCGIVKIQPRKRKLIAVDADKVSAAVIICDATDPPLCRLGRTISAQYHCKSAIVLGRGEEARGVSLHFGFLELARRKRRVMQGSV